jgi:hypothetical protein
LKSNYRKQLTALLINKLESGLDLEPKDINLYDSMLILNYSLKTISNQSIINCFKKAKFNFQSLTTIVERVDAEDDNENGLEFWDELKTLTNIEFNTFNDFISVDDNELVEITDDLSDEQIVNLVLNDKNEETVDLSDDESSETTVIQTISNSQALNAVNVLQHFFGQIGVNDVDQQLAEIQRKITGNTFKSLKQTKITDFFA